jgi:hypothetical protein
VILPRSDRLRVSPVRPSMLTTPGSPPTGSAHSGVLFGTLSFGRLVYGRAMPDTASYDALQSYLKARAIGNVNLTFDEIETLLGFQLPPAARLYKEWWTHGGDAGNAPQSGAWTDAGCKAWPNLFARSVSFERAISPRRFAR